ncbi:transglutaminase domain-containing protein [Paenibacillus sp. D51F]
MSMAIIQNSLQPLLDMEPVSLAVLLVIAVSLLQGFGRGARNSSQRLFHFIWEGVLLIAALAGAAKLAQLLSSPASRWLQAHVHLPQKEMAGLEQAWYTFLTSVRDLPLLRFGVLFLIGYALLRLLLSTLTPLAWRAFGAAAYPARTAEEVGEEAGAGSRRSANRAAGAVIGGLHGVGRSLVLLALLFLYVSVFPTAPLAGNIESSPVYRQAADKLLQPVAGGLLEGSGPVITEAVGSEFQQVLQRRYEIIDSNIPADIGDAARQVTAGAVSDRDKAELLYEWLGKRIAYDWDKADNYTSKGIWKEQTPEETFKSRKGVCIDTARLYAVMARSAGLEVRVVTGLGADGRGGFGSHAWNEVKLADEGGKWIPLDATWASTGDWFDTADFDKTHVRKV